MVVTDLHLFANLSARDSAPVDAVGAQLVLAGFRREHYDVPDDEGLTAASRFVARFECDGLHGQHSRWASRLDLAVHDGDLVRVARDPSGRGTPPFGADREQWFRYAGNPRAFSVVDPPPSPMSVVLGHLRERLIPRLDAKPDAVLAGRVRAALAALLDPQQRAVAERDFGASLATPRAPVELAAALFETGCRHWPPSR